MISTERDISFGIMEVGRCPLATQIGDLTNPTTAGPQITKIASFTGRLNLLGTMGIANSFSVESVKPNHNNYNSKRQNVEDIIFVGCFSVILGHIGP